jgi:hypothetical protein
MSQGGRRGLPHDGRQPKMKTRRGSLPAGQHRSRHHHFQYIRGKQLCRELGVYVDADCGISRAARRICEQLGAHLHLTKPPRSPPFLPLQGGGRPAKRVGRGSRVSTSTASAATRDPLPAPSAPPSPLQGEGSGVAMQSNVEINWAWPHRMRAPSRNPEWWCREPSRRRRAGRRRGRVGARLFARLVLPWVRVLRAPRWCRCR